MFTPRPPSSYPHSLTLILFGEAYTWWSSSGITEHSREFLWNFSTSRILMKYVVPSGYVSSLYALLTFMCTLRAPPSSSPLRTFTVMLFGGDCRLGTSWVPVDSSRDILCLGDMFQVRFEMNQLIVIKLFRCKAEAADINIIWWSVLRLTLNLLFIYLCLLQYSQNTRTTICLVLTSNFYLKYYKTYLLNIILYPATIQFPSPLSDIFRLTKLRMF
jgi:hypothetical protein